MSTVLLRFKPQAQRHLSYAIAILELLQYSRTLGVVSDTCHPSPSYLNSDKVFLLLSDRYPNPERGFKPGSLSVYLNLTHALNRSATTAGLLLQLLNAHFYNIYLSGI